MLSWTCPRCKQTMDARTMNHGDVCPARPKGRETPEERRERLKKYPGADERRGSP